MNFKIPSNYAEFHDLSEAYKYLLQLNDILKNGKDKAETLFKFAGDENEDLNIFYNHFHLLTIQSEELIDQIPDFFKNRIGLDEEEGPIRITNSNKNHANFDIGLPSFPKVIQKISLNNTSERLNDL
jgi:hypothetical protein